ncbi:MAG: T9SS type A sorting domain-containing protein [Lentimicrobiaceae bacterium]|nr:T9SS type A sorting domain-containing protein [Lentimicrobiaceae bacterium]
MKKLSLLFLFFALTVNTYAQNWPKTYSEFSQQIVEEIIETYDKGYLMRGICNYSGHSASWLMKTDINGNVLWSKVVDGNNNFEVGITSYAQTADGGLIMCGQALGDDMDVFVAKLNACGEKEWCKAYYVGNDPDSPWDIIPLPEGGYIVAAQDWGYQNYQTSASLVRLDEQGEILWEQSYAVNTTIWAERPYDLKMMENGDYILSGECGHPRPGTLDPKYLHPFFVKTDHEGNEIREKAWGVEEDFSAGVSQSAVSKRGNIYSPGLNYYDAFTSNLYWCPTMITTSPSGNEVRYKNIPDSTIWGGACAITWLPDSTLLVGVDYLDEALNDSVPWEGLYKLDTLGNVLSTKLLVNNEIWAPSSVINTRDNKIVVVSVGGEYGVNEKSYLWKLNQDLEYDSLYTQPRVYDSLCPGGITSGVIQLDCDSIMVGIKDPVNITEETNMPASPNPARENVTLSLPKYLVKKHKGDILTSTTRYNLSQYPSLLRGYDINGRQVYEEKLPAGTQTKEIDISNWQAGMYVFKLSIQPGAETTVKVMKTDSF